MWTDWEGRLQLKFIRLVRLSRNLIDLVWDSRPTESTDHLKVHPFIHAGEKWETKIRTLRKHLADDRCDAMIVTSLTEIAYLLNLRGNDLAYTPVFKAYLLVSQGETILYVNKNRINLGIILHLNSEPCETECVR